MSMFFNVFTILLVVFYIAITIFLLLEVDWKNNAKTFFKELGITYAFMIGIGFLKLLTNGCGNLEYIHANGITWSVVWITLLVALALLVLFLPVLCVRNTK